MKAHFSSKQKKIYLLLAAVFLAGIFGVLYWLDSRPYSPAPDEFAVRVQLDVKEDIGLLIYDYEINGHKYGGGISNADRSLLKRGEQVILVFRKDELNTEADVIEMNIRFRIITEYMDPNFENIYPEEITRYLDPLSLTFRFGETYDFTVTGGRETGYTVTFPE